MLTKTVLTACVAAACSMTALPSVARVVWVREAPPEVRVEPAPSERHGYQWVPGHWEWRNHHYVWHKGTWVRERTGYVYMAPTWVERDGRWYLKSGHWRRHDRDGDGVPNRLDSHPDDPTRK
jgi:hypothetical protein